MENFASENVKVKREGLIDFIDFYSYYVDDSKC